MRRYQANGFIPFESPPSRIHRLAAIVNIVKGDVLHDDGAGFATNAVTSLTGRFLGIAAADVDNSGDDNLSVEIYPFNPNTLYIVPVEADALITRTAAGVYANLQNNDDIDISDNPTEGFAFFIEDIDVSTDAVAANTYGYAIGRFRSLGTQA